jgi:ribonuclease P protein subunit POP4
MRCLAWHASLPAFAAVLRGHFEPLLQTSSTTYPISSLHIMTESKVPPFGQVLLERAFSPDTAATHYNERILKRPLTIRATSPTPSARAVRRRALNDHKENARKHSKQKPRPLSAAQRRKLCLNEIPKEQQKYAIYEPLHNLWLGYMREVLGINDVQRAVYLTPASSGQMLASADMHGALLSVARSRCVSRVGLQGIVVRDTRFTFEIITTRNVLKGKSRAQVSPCPFLTGGCSDTKGAYSLPLRDPSACQGRRRRAEAPGF